MKRMRFWILWLVFSLLHAGITFFGMVYVFRDGMARFDYPQSPADPWAKVLGIVVGVLSFPGAYFWSMLAKHSSAVEWSMFLSNSLLWGGVLAYIFSRRVDRGDPPLLADVLPELTREMTDLLLKSDDKDLAGQVDALRLVDRCRCGDRFCATIYTVRPPLKSWGDEHENVILDSPQGDIILDLVDRKIVCIETLGRADLRKKILKLVL